MTASRDERLSDIPRWRRYLRFWGADVTGDVDDEIAFHLEALIAHYVATGMTPDDARQLAVERFGDTDRIARSMRVLANQRETSMRQTEWLDALRRDVHFALRQLGRRRAFTAIALLTLALGIGANTAIFSAVNAVLLKPLPVRDLDRVVFVHDNLPKLGLLQTPLDPTETMEVATRSDLFVAAGGAWPATPIMTGGSEPRRLVSARTVGRFFDVFGVVPYAGRFYSLDEAENDRHRVAVLAFDFWRELGGDRSIIGRQIQLNGRAYEVIGVMQPGFRYPRGVQLWVPYPIDAQARVNRGRLVMHTVGRLRDDVTREQLDAPLETMARKLHEGSTRDELTMTSKPFVEVFAGQLRPTLLVLLGAVGFVLLIACANVASLQLVHGAARAREIAVRSALGAGKRTIVRQLLVENLVLAIGGGILGLAAGFAILRLLAFAGASELPALEGVRLDGAVLGFTAAATVVAGLLFGIVPAARAGRVDLQRALKEGTRSNTYGTHRSRLLRAGVVLQISLTLVLLLGSGLMIRSLGALLRQNPGFDSEHVSTVRLTVAGPRSQGAPLTLFYSTLLERLGTESALRPVGMISELPFSGSNDSSPFEIPGRTTDPGMPRLHANLHTIGGDYFKAMGIPVLRGRVFDATDVKTSQPVVVIDEELARVYFPNEDPIGKEIRQGMTATIIGVVGTVSQGELGEPRKATTYFPYSQREWYSTMYVTVRSSLPLASIVPMVREAVRSIDPNVPVYEPRTLDQRIGGSLAPRRLAMSVLTGLALLSLSLAVFGLYGVISYAVSQRTGEFGIRVALGAQPGHVRWMVVRQGMTLAAIGVVVGVGAAFIAMRALSKLLFGISPTDPLTFVIAPLILGSVAVIASYIPARRATKVSPLEALRS